jgi:hypothetical protein
MKVLVCIGCAYRHCVDALERGEDPGKPPTFDQSPAEHMASHHPDPQREQAELHARINKLPAEAFRLLMHDLGNATPTKERH